MSIRWLADVWEHSPYKGATLLVHLALADNANEAGECFPHLPTVLRKARISRTTGYEAIRTMQNDGLISYGGEEICRPSREHPFVLAPVQNLDASVRNPDAAVRNPDSEADHSSSIRTIKEPSVNPSSPVTSVTLEQEFEHWWSLYPKKIGKGAARLKFAIAVKKVGVERLNEAVLAYAADRKHKDAQYTLNPATWLHQERWDDELKGFRVVDEEYERAWARAHGRDVP